MGRDPLYLRNRDRVANRQPLRAALVALLSAHDGQDLYRGLMAAGVPCAPMLSVAQALALDHTRTREMTVDIDGYRVIGIPVKLSRTPGSIRLAPPGIGQHTTEVLQRHGFSGAQIDAALDGGYVRQSGAKRGIHDHH